MAFSYPRYRWQLVGMTLKVLKRELFQASEHRGEAVARVFIQSKVKKTGTQNSEEHRQRYRIDKQNLKTQQTRNKVQKERNYSDKKR